MFQFDGLVVENLDGEVLAGTPFMEANDIAVHPAKRLITLADGSSFTYGSSYDGSTQQAARRTVILRDPTTSTTLWCGDYIELELPQDLPPHLLHALEPRSNIPQVHLVTTSELWSPPGIISSVAGRIQIPNLSGEPIHLKRDEHFCQVSLIFTLSTHEQPQHIADLSKQSINLSPSVSGTSLSSAVRVDPNNLLQRDMQSSFRSLPSDFDSVFNPMIQGYNGAVGPLEARVNMGPVEPPQRKGRLPQYARSKLMDLQNKCDELEKLGVFKRPEDFNVAVEYLNPSFLVKTSNGG